MKPVEMFGRAEFPAIGDSPYMMTLGAHSFYWFSLESRPAIGESISVGTGPEHQIEGVGRHRLTQG